MRRWLVRLTLLAFCASVVSIGAAIPWEGIAAATSDWSGTAPLGSDHGICNVNIQEEGQLNIATDGFTLSYACQLALPSGAALGAFDDKFEPSVGVPSSCSGCHGDELLAYSPTLGVTIPFGASDWVHEGTCGVGRGEWWGLASGSPQDSANNFAMDCVGPFGDICTPDTCGFASPSAADDWFAKCPTYLVSCLSRQEMTSATYGTTVTSGDVAVEVEGWVAYEACGAFNDGTSSTGGGDEQYGSNYWECTGQVGSGQDNGEEPYYQQNIWSDPATGLTGACAGLNSSLVTPPQQSAVAFDTTGGLHEAATVESVTCSAPGGGTVTMPTSYYVGGSSTGGEGPCTLVGITGQTGVPGDGHTSIPFSVSFQGAVQRIVVDPSDTSGSTAILGQSFGSDAIESPANPSSPYDVDVTTASGYTVNPEFWCYDAGQWYWGSYANGASPTSDNQPGSTGFSLSTCLSDSLDSMNLFDPVSWVTGIGQATGCVLQWAFVPSSGELQTVGNTFGVTSSSPSVGTDSASQWLGSVVQGSAGLAYSEVGTIKSDADSGSCTLPDNPSVSIGSSSFSACSIFTSINPATAPAAAQPGLAIVRDVLAAMFYVLAAIMLVMLLRKLIAGTA